MHIGSEEETPLIEYVVVEEENTQEQQPGEGKQHGRSQWAVRVWHGIP
jgi:hypothetical protein